MLLGIYITARNGRDATQQRINLLTITTAPNMKTITLTDDNYQISDGRYKIGTQTFQSRSGSFLTYEVRISRKAVQRSQLSPGDKIIYFEWGLSDYSYQSCAGFIVKPDGTRYHLEGGRDNGIDTGHPVQLGLKMMQVAKVVEDCEGIPDLPTLPSLIRYKPTMECFLMPNMATGTIQTLGIEYMRSHEHSTDIAFHNMTVPYPVRIHEIWEACDYAPDWERGRFEYRKKRIKLVDTDIPIVDKI